MAYRRVLHLGGCGGVMFYVYESQGPDCCIKSEYARLLDGSEPEPFHAIVCGTCGMSYVEVMRLDVDGPLYEFVDGEWEEV